MTTKIDPEVAARECDELVQLELRLADLSLRAKRLADECGLSRREIALQMGNLSPSNLQRLLRGMAGRASLETLSRFAWACGQDLQVSFVPRTTARREPDAKVAAEAKALVLLAGATKKPECCNNVIELELRRAEYALFKKRWVETPRQVPGNAPSEQSKHVAV